MRQSKTLSESVATAQQFAKVSLAKTRDDSDCVMRLAMVNYRLGNLERQCFEARLSLGGASLNETATSIQTVVVSKSKFSKSQAVALAKRNNWSSEMDETADSYRFRQKEPTSCQTGSFRTITLKEGVQAVICKPKESKNEQSNDEAHSKFRSALKSKGFTKSSDGGEETHTKGAANGHSISVKLSGGMAHTKLVRNGIVRRVIGSAITVGGLYGDIDSAQDEAEEAGGAAEEAGETNATQAAEAAGQ